MAPQYTNLSLGFPIFGVVSMSSVARESGSETDANEKCSLPNNSFVVVGGGGSSRSGIKNNISVLQLQATPAGLTQAVILFTFDTGSSCCTSVHLSRKGRFLAASVGSSCKVLRYSRVLPESAEDETRYTKQPKKLEAKTSAAQGSEGTKESKEKDHNEETTKDDKPSNDKKGAKLDKSAKAKQSKAAPNDTSSEEGSTSEHQFDHIVDFVTDKPFKESVHPCQNVVKFCKTSETRLATGGDDCNVYVWDLVETQDEKKDKVVWKAELVYKLQGHTKEVKDIDFDPSDKLLASTSSLDKTCRIWDMETGKQAQLLPAATSSRLSFRICKFVSETELMTLQTTIGGRGSSFLVMWKKSAIWEVSAIQLVSKGMATSFCYTKDKKYIGVSDTDGSVSLLDATTLKQLKKVHDVHNLPITGLSTCPLSPDPQEASPEFLVTSSMDRVVSMIEVKHSSTSSFWKLALLLLLFFLFFMTLQMLGVTVVDQEQDKEL